MKTILRKLLPQSFINYFWHLPKAVLANFIYGFPTRGLKVIGITGTDGKTTTANMIYQILKDVGKKVSIVSTIDSPGLHVTSPDPFMVQKFARESKINGNEYLVLEVTSHSLDQFRFWGVNFLVGVITNITHEHLDYHKIFENYFQAKIKLIKNAKLAVINQNLKGSIDNKVVSKVTTFGLTKGNFNQKDVKLNLKIPGDYNIENALAALAVASVLGIDSGQAIMTLEKFENLTGRMEEVKNSKGIKIFIDFAHTPNGLEQTLKTLRLHPKGAKLISIIGCEGFRDVGKRSLMGEISGKLADITVVTPVDPRGQLDSINKQIIKGLLKSKAKQGKSFFIIDDRQKAINFAVQKLAKTGDIVGIFGKGHERSINMDGKIELSWSDKKAVEKALNYG